MTTNLKPKRIRDTVFIAHRYIGLAVGLLAAAIGLTGSLLIIHGWTGEWFEPKVPEVTITPTGERLAISTLITKAQTLFPTLKLESLEIPKKLTEPISAWWSAAADKSTFANINPYTGAIIGDPHQYSNSNTYTSFLYSIHINLLGGEQGAYIAGIVGLLATILCITGIILWPGWRKLTTGFKIKWNAKAKRFNFDLHKVVGIIAAVFLSMAMFTGFTWNYETWANPLIYAATFSSPPVEQALVSKAIAGQAPLKVTDKLLQTASDALPAGKITAVYLPTKPDGIIRVEKALSEQVTVSASVDQYSGKILKVDGLSTKKSMGDRVLDSFYPVHFGTFAGEASRILYVFVGLSPTILLVTGFIMWQNRRKRSKPAAPQPQEKQLNATLR